MSEEYARLVVYFRKKETGPDGRYPVDMVLYPVADTEKTFPRGYIPSTAEKWRWRDDWP